MAAMCGTSRLPPGICLGCLFLLFSFCLEFWRWPHFQVVLATGLAGEEGPLLLELSQGKCLSRNKHGSHLNTTAAVDLTKQTGRAASGTGAFSSRRISGEVWKFPHKNFQIKYKRMILKERKIKLARMTSGGCFPNTAWKLPNKQKVKNPTLKYTDSRKRKKEKQQFMYIFLCVKCSPKDSLLERHSCPWQGAWR